MEWGQKLDGRYVLGTHPCPSIARAVRLARKDADIPDDCVLASRKA